MRTSRPATADRRMMTWEEVAGGGDMGRREGEGEGEERKMRRPSQQSLEGVGLERVGVSLQQYNIWTSESVPT